MRVQRRRDFLDLHPHGSQPQHIYYGLLRIGVSVGQSLPRSVHAVDETVLPQIGCEYSETTSSKIDLGVPVVLNILSKLVPGRHVQIVLGLHFGLRAIRDRISGPRDY